MQLKSVQNLGTYFGPINTGHSLQAKLNDELRTALEFTGFYERQTSK